LSLPAEEVVIDIDSAVGADLAQLGKQALHSGGSLVGDVLEAVAGLFR